MSTDLATAPKVEIPNHLAQRVQSLTIVDDDTYALAVEIERDIKAVKTQASALLDPFCEAANRAHKAATAKRKEIIDPLDKMTEAVKAKRVTYSIAKAERERIAQEAERTRLAEIARQEAARQTDLEQKAEEAQAFGIDDLAEELEQEATAAGTAAIIAHRQAERVKPGKPEGVRENWKWRVTDKTLIPREFLVPDTVTLDFCAKKKRDQSIPGIEFYPEHIAITTRG
jgi:hypothetical protein